MAETKNAPKNYPEFEAYVCDFMNNNLKQTETFSRSRIVRKLDIDPLIDAIPHWLWKPIAPVTLGLLVWVTTGLLLQNLRDEYGWNWTKSDQIRFFLFSRVVCGIFAVLPRRVRMVPIAERAFRKAEASEAAKN
nr:oxygenase MpaB family protein [Corynebacterium poyangense]